MTPPRMPAELGRAGQELWRRMWKAYTFDPAETEVVRLACRAQDRAAALRKIIEKDGYKATGSMGQEILHPAVAELRQTEAQVVNMLGKIGFESDGTGRDTRFTAATARAAANARWKRAG